MLSRFGRWYQPQLEVLEDRRLLSAGAVDPTFGHHGVTAPDLDTTARAIVTLGDGKIVVLDQSALGYDLLRYNADGTPDSTFGVNGKVAATFGTGTTVFGLAVLNDGHLVVGGDHLDDQTTFLDLARFNR